MILAKLHFSLTPCTAALMKKLHKTDAGLRAMVQNRGQMSKLTS